ncbi:hypothetical protein OPV22_028774 [Ensete ventricosum]|uniref:AMP-dependent synthetase/ligase domain-containing protein n=1 Tax=Ensete ventricosum TaxID=4639 RepID=A0AAV8PZA8_ENSVE|nr:hypothetical protein OPV22_028774 [Ensete ventricosum]
MHAKRAVTQLAQGRCSSPPLRWLPLTLLATRSFKAFSFDGTFSSSACFCHVPPPQPRILTPEASASHISWIPCRTELVLPDPFLLFVLLVSGTTGGPKRGCGRLRRSFVDNSDWSNFRRKLFIHIIQHSTHTGRSSS